MITIKALNCIHQDRKNQNVTFNIWQRQYGDKIDVNEITEEWILHNFQKLKPIDVELQKNTKVKILNRC